MTTMMGNFPVVSMRSTSEAIDVFRNPENFPYIAVDTETNGKDVRDGSGLCHGISIGVKVPGPFYLAHYFPFFHREGEGTSNLESDTLFELKEAIESYTGIIIFHNAKFDLESLRSIGINYTGRFYCTMLMAHLINENMPYSKSLDACAQYYLKEPGKRKSPLWEAALRLYGWEGMPSELMREYAEYDAVSTLRLFEKLFPLWHSENLDEYWWEHKSKFLRVIIKMERRGVRIDTQKAARMIVHGEMIMEDIVEILQLNPGSTKDLEKLLIEQMGLGLVKPTKGTANLPEDQWKPSFDKEAMEVYDRALELRNDPTAVHILTYRGWQKAVSSNYRPYLELLSPDGRLRPNYKLHGTKTGRSSCEKPNLQQIPRSGDKPWNGDMKSTFLGADGYGLWEADFGQLEFRLGAAYAQEPKLISIFNDPNRDIFSEMSDELGMPRQDCKTQTYTIQYGGGINRLSTVFGISKEAAAQRRDNFYLAYPGLRRVSTLASAKCKSLGKLKIWSGRYRHFRFPKDEAHKAFNSVIQGGAADYVERVMIALDEQVVNDECRMLLTVHDSVVFEIKEGMEEKYLPEIERIMTTTPPDFGVKFKVDIHRFGE